MAGVVDVVILVVSLMAAMFLTAYWRVILSLLAIATLTLIFAGILTLLDSGNWMFSS